ncbi:MAG: hypothetical protein PHO32_07800, partial [Candidatus Cloacimonetes bacterium]|nr:hypothetical protein [Candidatus Cloacimonadota bacterium]
MKVKASIIQGKYLDSVKLMLISKRLREEKGIIDAVAILATKENLQILAATDMLVPEISEAAETDLVVVIKADEDSIADAAVLLAHQLVNQPPAKNGGEDSKLAPTNLQAAIKQ